MAEPTRYRLIHPGHPERRSYRLTSEMTPDPTGPWADYRQTRDHFQKLCTDAIDSIELPGCHNHFTESFNRGWTLARERYRAAIRKALSDA